MKSSKVLTESLEDYLESIYRNIVRNNAARVKDIAADLGVRYPSVTSALKVLEKKGLIDYEPYGIITLTAEGLAIALRITERHRLLRAFFSQVLAVDPVVADETACRLEHVIPPDVFQRLVQFFKFFYLSQEGNDSWQQSFRDFMKKNPVDIGCSECLDEFFDGTGFSREGDTSELDQA